MDKHSKIRQRNGEIVFDALRSMDNPKTLTDIVNYVAASNNTQPDRIKGTVKEVLNAAVQYGFIKKSGFKYSMKPVEPRASTSESDMEKTEPTDAGRKRKRSRGGRKSRSRSRRRRVKI